jgi:glycosyltransferase involved in cell wall biosynthesis
MREEKIQLMEKVEVTATISTKDRYFETLPLTIQSIINQERKPKKILIFDDSHDRKDLREVPLYAQLFHRIDREHIQWEVIYGECKGQVLNHQKALEYCGTDWIWRIDDDEFAENIIEDTISHHQICIEDMEIFLSYTYKEYALIIDGLSVALTLEDKKAKQGMLRYISKHAGFVDVAMNHTIAEYEDIIPKLKESRAFWL